MIDIGFRENFPININQLLSAMLLAFFIPTCVLQGRGGRSNGENENEREKKKKEISN